MRLRLTPLAIALALPVGAMAQSVGDCPGGDLTECIVNTNPPALQELRDGGIDIEGGAAAGARGGVEVGSTLREGSSELSDPAGTGLTADPDSAYFDTGSSYVRTDPSTGEVLEVREHGGSGTGVRRGGSSVSGGAMQPNALGGDGITRGDNVTRGANAGRAGAGSAGTAPEAPLAEDGAQGPAGTAANELDEGPTEGLEGSGTNTGVGSTPGPQGDPALDADVGGNAGRELDVGTDADLDADVGTGVDGDAAGGLSQ